MSSLDFIPVLAETSPGRAGHAVLNSDASRSHIVFISIFLTIVATFRLIVVFNFQATDIFLPTALFFIGSLATLALGIKLRAMSAPVAGNAAIAFALFQLSLVGMREIVPVIFYISRGIPLQDGLFATIDQALGFNWVGYASLLTDTEIFRPTLKAAYMGIFYIPTFVCLSMVFLGDMRRLCVFIFAMSISLYFATAIAAIFPCLGAYEYFIDSSEHIKNIFGDQESIGIALKLARAGSFKEELATGTAIVQFPSYHACAGVLFLLAAPRTALGIVIVIVSGLLLVATPIAGSHYLTDILAGGAIGFASWVMADQTLTWASGFDTKMFSMMQLLHLGTPCRTDQRQE